MSKVVITINLDKIKTVGDTKDILMELAEDMHAGNHDIYYKRELVGDYKVVHL
jgi:hypothetical protein